MIEDTLLSFTTQNTIFIKKLYYDLIDKQFIVNSDEINHSQINNLLNLLEWHGRKNPIEVGKPIICKNDALMKKP